MASIIPACTRRFQCFWPLSHPASLPEWPEANPDLPDIQYSATFGAYLHRGFLHSPTRLSSCRRPSCPRKFWCGSQLPDSTRNVTKERPRHGHLGHLEHHILRTSDHPGTNLGQLGSQRSHLLRYNAPPEYAPWARFHISVLCCRHGRMTLR
jgi:hypothetical protein